MARCEVIQVQCDRCKRVELRAPQPAKAKPDFEATLLGDRIVFQDLCIPCTDTLKGQFELLRRWTKPCRQHFGPTVPENQAPNLSPAPNYSPPLPHSAAAGKR